MIKPKGLNNLYNRYEIAQKLGVDRSTVTYHIRNGRFPLPKITLYLVKFAGERIKIVPIDLWTHNQLQTIKNRMSRVTRGRYTNNVHPIKARINNI